MRDDHSNTSPLSSPLPRPLSSPSMDRSSFDQEDDKGGDKGNDKGSVVTYLTLRLAALLGLLLAAGCKLGPDYHRPAALGTNAMPAVFLGETNPEGGPGWKPAEPSAHLPRGAW